MAVRGMAQHTSLSLLVQAAATTPAFQGYPEAVGCSLGIQLSASKVLAHMHPMPSTSVPGKNAKSHMLSFEIVIIVGGL